MPNKILDSNKLSNQDYDRYSRNIIIKEIGIYGQQRLKSSKIICVGAGGLNSPAMLYLTACGVGTIGIIDDDIIEMSNLQRQIIYNTTDIYNLKTTTAKKKLQLINPLIKIKTYTSKLSSINIKMIFSEYDIIIDGTDNLNIRQLISLYCYQLHKIHIYGAIDKFIGYVSVFNYQNGPNYFDIYSNIYHTNTNICETIGVLNTLAGLIGITQATEAIKIITGIGSVLSGYLLQIDPINLSYKKIKIQSLKYISNKYSHISRPINIIYKIQYITLQEIKNKTFTQYLLIDIRNSIEFQKQHIDYSVNIPLDNFKKLSYINDLKTLSNYHTIVIYCNNKLRSLICSQILNYHLIQHCILNKGIQDL